MCNVNRLCVVCDSSPTQARVLEIALGVAQGMTYMHSLSICHGDLK